MDKSFVYIFCDPSQDLFKIGVTKNLGNYIGFDPEKVVKLIFFVKSD